MLIVDAQVHIWSGGKPGNPNHRQVAAFTKDDLLGIMGNFPLDKAESRALVDTWPAAERAGIPVGRWRLA